MRFVLCLVALIAAASALDAQLPRRFAFEPSPQELASVALGGIVYSVYTNASSGEQFLTQLWVSDPFAAPSFAERMPLPDLTVGTLGFFVPVQPANPLDQPSTALLVDTDPEPSINCLVPGTPSLFPYPQMSYLSKDPTILSVMGGVLFAGGTDYYGNVTNVVEFFRCDGKQPDYERPLSRARKHMAGAAIGTIAVFAGGLYNNGVSDVWDLFDMVTGSETSGKLAGGARYFIAAGTSGSKMVFAGGSTATSVSNAIDVLDVNTRKWTQGELSEARTLMVAVSLGAVPAAQAGVTFVGGFVDGRRASAAVDTVFTAGTNAAGDNWEVHSTQLQTARTDFALVALGSMVAVVGGIDAQAQWRLDTVELFDVSQTPTPPPVVLRLSGPRSFPNPFAAGALNINDYSIVLVGGRWDTPDGKMGVPPGLVEVFDRPQLAALTNAQQLAQLSEPVATLQAQMKALQDKLARVKTECFNAAMLGKVGDGADACVPGGGDGPSKSNTGAIVGGIVGGLVGAAVTVGVAVWISRRNKQSQQHEGHTQLGTDDGSFALMRDPRQP